MKTLLARGVVQQAQEALIKLNTRINDLGKPALGPQFKNLGGAALNDALVCHRLTAKFEVPEACGNDVSKAVQSINKMLAYDNAYDNKNLFKGHRILSRFLEARAWLNTTLKGYKPSYKVVFPSGESVNSAKGEVDLWYKLTRPDQWTVSSGCLNYAAKICYVNLQLKRLVKARFYATPGAQRNQKLWVEAALAENPKAVGWYVFKRMFAYTVDIVGYSRLTTVPKNNNEDRVITCDPTWNLVVQRSIALDLLTCLRKNRGINLDRLQELHGSLIAHRSKATIDMSKASDSNWTGIFQLLFPRKIVKNVLSARTGIAFDGENYLRLNQLAPMGCGFTFEIMTLTLLSYARAFDKGASVYGDDIIVERSVAGKFITFVTAMGWKVNINKTFVDGNFSESCGAFYNHDLKYHIVSFDMWYPTDISMVLSAGNKLRYLLEANQVSPSVRRIIRECYEEICSCVPDVVKRARRPNDGEDSTFLWAEDPEVFTSKFHGLPGTKYHGMYLKNEYAKRITFKADVEFEPPLDGVGQTLLTCYMYRGLMAVGPRSGQLVYEVVLSAT